MTQPTDDIKLPPLPEPDGEIETVIARRTVKIDTWRPSSMESYARAAVLEYQATVAEAMRDAAEIIDTLTSRLPPKHPLRKGAEGRAKKLVAQLYRLAGEESSEK